MKCMQWIYDKWYCYIIKKPADKQNANNILDIISLAIWIVGKELSTYIWQHSMWAKFPYWWSQVLGKASSFTSFVTNCMQDKIHFAIKFCPRNKSTKFWGKICLQFVSFIYVLELAKVYALPWVDAENWILDHLRVSLRLPICMREHLIPFFLEHMFPGPPNPMSRLDIEQFLFLESPSRFPVSMSKTKMQAVVRNFISRVDLLLTCCAFVQKKVRAVYICVCFLRFDQEGYPHIYPHIYSFGLTAIYCHLFYVNW